MIELTRLNGTPILLNSDLIKTCEAAPDTMITLINGEKLIVREELRQVEQRVLGYRARLLAAVMEHAPGHGDASVLENLASLAAAERTGRSARDARKA